jgi:hypothetical protein
MKDDDFISKLKKIIGLSIIEINYIESKFYHSEISGNWTNVNPKEFVLHSPEWQLKLSNGETIYISASTEKRANLSSEIIIAEKSCLKEINVLKIENKFEWAEILNKPILKFRLWNRVIKSAKFLGSEFNVKLEKNFQIITLSFGGKTLSFTTMNGDFGEGVFYPTGYLSESIGVFLNKETCKSHTTYDLTMRMKITYES